MHIASNFLGNLPGAGGNPWVGLIYVISLIAGAGLFKFAFFTVRKNERGVWLRLGQPVRYWSDSRPRILRPGRLGVVFPFIWRLDRIAVNLRTSRTEDIETTRFDPAHSQRQKWVFKADVNWRVQTDGYRLVRAALRVEDLPETVLAIVMNAIRSSLHAATVGTVETDAEVLAAVKDRANAQLAATGVSVSSINVIKYAPVDAQILANAIAPQPSSPEISAAARRPERIAPSM